MLRARTLGILLLIVACLAALTVYGCAPQEETDTLPSDQPEYGEPTTVPSDHPEYVETITVPSRYLEVSVSPGAISADIGEQVEIRCKIYSVVNTPVEITSVELVVFDSAESLLREQAMTTYSYWSAHTLYTIAGDEAYYRLKVNFTTPYADPGEYSEFTADSFPITVN